MGFGTGRDPKQLPCTTMDGSAGLPVKEVEVMRGQELELPLVDVEVVGGDFTFNGGSFGTGGRGGGVAGGAPVYSVTVSLPVNSA